MASLPKHLQSAAHSAAAPNAAGRCVSASQAKTHLLELLKDIDDKQETVIITKRGRPIARLVPIEAQPTRDIFGFMKGTGQILGDVVGPEPDLWEAMSE